MNLYIRRKPKSHPVLLNNLLTGARVRQDLHFSVELCSAFFYDRSHSIVLQLYLQAQQVRWNLTLDILRKTIKPMLFNTDLKTLQ